MNDLRRALERIAGWATEGWSDHDWTAPPTDRQRLSVIRELARQALSAEGRLGPAALHVEAEGGGMTMPDWLRARSTWLSDPRAHPDIRQTMEDAADEIERLAALSQPSPDGDPRIRSLIEAIADDSNDPDEWLGGGTLFQLWRDTAKGILAALPPLASGEGKGRLGAERLHVAHDPAAKPLEGGE